MTYTLPTDSEANASSMAQNAEVIATANAAFIADTTVLINNAISFGEYFVQPIIGANVDIPTVTTYFENVGYTVLYPIPPVYPPNPAFVPGFPEVLPPGYVPPNQPYVPGPIRMQISWQIT